MENSRTFVFAQHCMLGLKQNVSRDQFHALCENRNPQNDDRPTQRLKKEDKRRVFYDFTCSALKSVSVLAVTLNDQRLVVAHEEAARIAFRELETFAATRVRKQGNQRDRTAGNLVAAQFIHTSSRELDPLLHTHCTVFNATFDDKERYWKALQARPTYDEIRYATAIYRNELAKRIQAIGYQTRLAKHGFEIEGLSDEILKRFSKRAQQRDEVVRAMEQKWGRKLSNDEIAYAVHQSRAKKIKGISTAEVRLKVQRMDGTEGFFPLGRGAALWDVGETRKLKVAVGDRLLLQSNAAPKQFINGELVEVKAIQGSALVARVVDLLSCC